MRQCFSWVQFERHTAVLKFFFVFFAVFSLCTTVDYSYGQENAEESFKLYQKGKKSEEEGNNKEAFKWFLKAAELGDGDAQYKLAFAYLKGNGVAKNYERTVFWFKKAHAQNIPDIKKISGTLGVMYENGNGFERDYAKALEMYTIAMERIGYNRELAARLGLLYLEGKGVEQSYTNAARWFNEASFVDEIRVPYAKLLLEGKGTKQDIARAVDLLSRAADYDRNTDAQLFLAKLYYEGQYIPKDEGLALYLYRELSNEGNATAQEIFLGILLEKAAANDARAQLFLSEYYSSIGDEEKALQMLRASAKNGNELAQFELKKMKE